MKGMVVYKRATMDFGDSCSSLVIRIVQEKFLALMCKHNLTKHIIVSVGMPTITMGASELIKSIGR